MLHDDRFMRAALDEARQAEALGEVPVGAVVVANDRIVGRGHNAPISRRDPAAHAEILALRDAAATLDNYRLIGATLYVTVEPCLMCLGAAIHARIGGLVWGAPDPKVGAVAALERLRDEGALFNHRFDILGDVLAEESASLLRGFFARRRDDEPSRTVTAGGAARQECGEVPKWS